jgi:hypothetical protein
VGLTDDISIDFAELAARIEADSAGAHSHVHGIMHWRAVAQSGLYLAGLIEDLDPALILLFGLLHDSCRENEFDDPYHGHRAAQLLERLDRERIVRLSPERASTLMHALSEHDAGYTSEDPNVGACWDADRLQLQRLGFALDPDRLSHEISQTDSVQQAVRGYDWQPMEWDDLAQLADELIAESRGGS